MSKIPSYTAQPLPKAGDTDILIARLEEMLSELESVLVAIKAVADDHEARIDALET